MRSKSIKKRIVMAVASIATVCSAMIATPLVHAQAEQASTTNVVKPNTVVPNNYYCYTDNYARHGYCFQVNGPHDRSLQDFV